MRPLPSCLLRTAEMLQRGWCCTRCPLHVYGRAKEVSFSFITCFCCSSSNQSTCAECFSPANLLNCSSFARQSQNNGWVGAEDAGLNPLEKTVHSKRSIYSRLNIVCWKLRCPSVFENYIGLLNINQYLWPIFERFTSSVGRNGLRAEIPSREGIYRVL